MIESIHIKEVATYGNTPEIMDGLSQFNFVFGSNGTGKTTISKIINNEAAFPSCRVNWKGGTKLEPLVYNEDFVKKNFEQFSELKGVFTLGEKSSDTLKKIADAKNEHDELTKKIENLTRTLEGEDGTGGKKGELEELEEGLKNTCWGQKRKHDEKLQGEGERSFVTFLYFYHLLKGSQSEDGMSTNRVVVFDDPVSSLDSEVLFVVSSLIRGLFDDVRNEAGYIKQVFILTHNVYFHREVTFNVRRTDRAMNEETFWIVRKPGRESKLPKVFTKSGTLVLKHFILEIPANFRNFLGSCQSVYICVPLSPWPMEVKRKSRTGFCFNSKVFCSTGIAEAVY